MIILSREEIAKVVLLSIVFPSAIIAAPFLILGLPFALPILLGMASDPLEIPSILESAFQPKNIFDITPIAVPFGFWGLYTLWAVWDQISRGKRMAAISDMAIHMGLCAGVISTLLLQGFLHWKAYPFYLPIVAASGFYWLLFTSKETSN